MPAIVLGIIGSRVGRAVATGVLAFGVAVMVLFWTAVGAVAIAAAVTIFGLYLQG